MADMNTRLAALERRCSTMEAQMRTQNSQVIEVFRKAISVLEASSIFNNVIDEGGMLTAVDNSPTGELALQIAASDATDGVANLKCETVSFRLDDNHPALKRRRTMADPRSMNHDQADPTQASLANTRRRGLSIASNESGELDDETSPLHRKRQDNRNPGMSRRDQQQSEGNKGVRGAAQRDSRQQDGAVDSNEGKRRDNSTAGRQGQHGDDNDARNQSRHRSPERSARKRENHTPNPSRRRSSRRDSRGYNRGRGRSRSQSRSISPSRNRHDERRKYQERQKSPPPTQKPKLTGSNAEPVPPGGPRRGRYNANRNPSPGARPTPQKGSEGPKLKAKDLLVSWGAGTGSKHISGRVKKNVDNNWSDSESLGDAGGQYSGWDIGSPPREEPKAVNKGWDTGSPLREAPSVLTKGWDTCSHMREGPSSYNKGWDVTEPVLDETGPTMPRSINQLTSKVEPISAVEKVAAWRGADLTVHASPHRADDAVKAALSDCGSDDLGDKAHSSNLDVTDRLFEDNIISDDDDDDDDDDPRMLLKSKQRRSEIIVSMLNDSGGHPLTSERMAPLWKIFAWIPLDTLPEVYQRVHGVALWTPETKRQIRASIKDLPDLSERSSMDGLSRRTLIFRDKCHLKQPRAYQRLFVMSPVCEPVLFYYLVTTIMQPLDEAQAKTIACLWMDEFRKGPTQAITAMQARGGATTKWESDEVVWKAAIDWLGQLAKVAMNHGKGYLTGKTTNWDTVGLLLSRRDSQVASNDPEKELVAGLLKDELTELLNATPMLLSKILPENKLRILRSELC